MYYIVGLGNPGEKYTNTRHNVGFQALAYIVERATLPQFVESGQHSGEISRATLFGHEVTLLRPSTFMNNSGSAVKKLVQKGEEQQLIVIYDDVDLPPGTVKVSFNRGSGGHNGISSIIKEIDTRAFVRIRIGIAKRGFFGGVVRPKGEKLSSHVLGKLQKREEGEYQKAYETVCEVVQVIMQDGVDAAMQKYNADA